MRIVTFSRSITIVPTYTCHLRCRYCSFWSATDGLIPRSQARALMRQAYRAGCREALIMSGDAPWLEPGFAVNDQGYVDFVFELCEMALHEGLLPHTNIGVVAPRHLEQLHQVNPSMGLMLESVNDDLPAHRGARGKRVAARLGFLRAAGELRIPFTTGILVGIDESAADRRATLGTIRGLHEQYGHIQEIIVQNFRARPGTPMAGHPEPPPELMVETVELARAILPAMSIQIPPNLNANYVDLVRAGANDLGGVSPDVDHINPDHRFPPPPDIERALAAIGCGLRERLPVYPEVRADWSPAARRLRAIAAPADVRLEAPGAAADAPTSERRSGLGSASSLRLPAPDDLVCTLDASREAALRAAAGRRYRPRFSLRAGEGWAERVATLDRLRTLHLSSGAFDGLVIRAEPAVPPEERLRALAYARLYLGKEWPDVGLSWADGPALALDGLSVGGSAVWDVPPVSWGWLAAELAARGLAPRRPAAVGVGGRA